MALPLHDDLPHPESLSYPSSIKRQSENREGRVPTPKSEFYMMQEATAEGRARWS